MKAILLCAGEGSRLRPFTFTQPKHLLPIVGKPLLTHTIEGLKQQGIKEFIIIVGHLEEKIREYYQDGSELGIKITYINQPEPEGTAQAIGLIESEIADDWFFVQYGDVMVSPPTYNVLFKEFDRNGRKMIVTGREVEDPSTFGVLELDGNSLVRIVEKPKPGTEPSKLANAGLYIFNNQIFEKIKLTKKSKRGEYEITDPIQMLINDGVEIKTFQLPFWWKDIGLPWNLLEANKLILDELPDSVLIIKGTMEPGSVVKNRVGIGEGTIIRSGVYLKGPILIGKNCDIGPNSYIRDHTVICDNVRIGHACEIKASLVMDDTRIPHLSYIGDSIIGRNVNLAAGTITANLKMDKTTVKATIKEERIDTMRRKLGAIIGDNSQTGIGTTLMPGVVIGMNCAIGPNINVFDDVPSNTFLLGKEEKEVRQWKIK